MKFLFTPTKFCIFIAFLFSYLICSSSGVSAQSFDVIKTPPLIESTACESVPVNTSKVAQKVKETYAQFKYTNVLDLSVNSTTHASADLIKETKVRLDTASFVSYNNSSEIKEFLLASPKILTVRIPYYDSILTIDLVQADIFNSTFTIESSGEGKLDVDLGIHYQGVIRGVNPSMVGMSFFKGEFTLFAALNDGNTRVIEGGLSVSKHNHENFHVLYGSADLNVRPEKNCYTESLQQYESAVKKIKKDTSLMIPFQKAILPCVTYFWETTYSMYQSYGSNQAVTTHMTSVFNNFQLLMINEGIGSQLNQLYIWSTPDSYNDDLNTFSSNRTNFNADLATLFSANGSGGVAWLDVLCTQGDYYRHGFCGAMNQPVPSVPIYSWTVEVTTHEIGHNLGSPHTHACVWNGNNTPIDGCGPQAGYNEGCTGPLPNSGTIMSYCHLTSVGIDFNLGFGNQPGNLVLSRVNSCTSLTCNTGGTINLICQARVNQGQWQALSNCEITVCEGSYLELAADPNGLASYQWTGPNGFSGAGNIDGNILISSAITAAQAGVYTVDVVDNGATGTTSINVIVQSAPNVSVNNETICTGDAVTLTASGASTYSWSNGLGNGSTKTVSPNSTTTYTVTGVSNSGCSNTATATVTVESTPTTPTISSSSGSSFCQGQSSTLTASGNSGGTYTWSDGSTGQSISVSNAGTYTVVYETSGGCESPISSPITLTIDPLPTVVANNESICEGDNVTIAASGAASYTWDNGLGNGVSHTVSPTVTTTYTVTGTSSIGCSNTATVVVDVNPLPVIESEASFDGGNSYQLTPSNQVVICEGLSLFLSGFPNTMPSYQWTGPNNFSQFGGANTNGDVLISNSVSINDAGTYTLIATDNNGCSNSLDVQVSINALPGTTVNDVSICLGDTVDLVASGATSYEWLNGQGNTSTISVSPSTNTNYTVVGTSSAGCTDTVTAGVFLNGVPATPSISVNGSTSLCQGESVTLTATGSASNNYQWSNGATTQSILVSTNGTFEVISTNGVGCSSTPSNPMTISVNPIPVITVNDATICEGESTVITASGASTYMWDNNLGNGPSKTVSPTSSTTYTVIGTSATGCVDSATAIVTVNSLPMPPVISANGPMNFCLGDSVILTSSEPLNNDWSTGQTTQDIMVSSSGIYTTTYTDVNGCSATSNPVLVSVNANPITPVITASGPLEFCQGDDVYLSTSQTSGSLLWSTGETSSVISVSSSGNYDVTYTDTNGCSVSSTPVSIVVNSLPNPPTISASGATSICQGNAVTLTSSEPTNNIWSDGSTNDFILVSTGGVYDVTYVDSNGCSAVSSPITITVNPLPNPVVTLLGDSVFCAGDGTSILSSVVSGNVWSSGETQFEIFPTTSGSYWTVVTDNNGCIGTSNTINVTVNQPPLVTMSPISPICENYSAIVLNQGSPAGGSYSGSGVQIGTFDPGIAGVGTHVITYEYMDANGCINTAQTDVLVDACLSVEEAVVNPISIYPNPTDGMVFIESSVPIELIRIYDATGRIVLEQKVVDQNEVVQSGVIRVDLDFLATAVYYIEIISSVSRSVNELIVR